MRNDKLDEYDIGMNEYSLPVVAVMAYYDMSVLMLCEFWHCTKKSGPQKIIIKLIAYYRSTQTGYVILMLRL